jgi:hypothetical protein
MDMLSESKESTMQTTSGFETILESVERLSEDDQEVLVDLVRQRLSERKRQVIAKNIADAREEYRTGKTQRGTVDDFLKEIKD